MNKFKLFILLFLSLGLFFSGCEKKKTGEPVKIHWDRDACERCNMILSDRRFAFEIINPTSGKVHKFDDMGCGIMWLKERNVPWKNRAIIWIIDAKNGKWINARKAYYTTGNVTPMAYGLAGYTKKTLPKGKKSIDYKKAVKHIYKIDKLEEKKEAI